MELKRPLKSFLVYPGFQAGQRAAHFGQPYGPFLLRRTIQVGGVSCAISLQGITVIIAFQRLGFPTNGR